MGKAQDTWHEKLEGKVFCPIKNCNPMRIEKHSFTTKSSMAAHMKDKHKTTLGKIRAYLEFDSVKSLIESDFCRADKNTKIEESDLANFKLEAGDVYNEWKLRKGQWIRKTSEDEKDYKSKNLYCCIRGCEKARSGKHHISAHMYY